MNFNAFVGGIEPGGLTNDFEVKILICFLLKKIEQPLSFEQINEILQKTGFVNYFEFVEAISELQKTEHVLPIADENGEEVFELTEIGGATAQTFHHTLPLTVREKTVEAARELIQMQKQLEETEVRYHAVEDGYMLTMKMKDIGSDLMDLSVFVPSEDECVEIRERIYADPLLLYKALLSVLMGDYEGGKQLFEEKMK
ncbi:MAG: DUF4364 family protein [Oscillospiraceae bacterium]|nr:DUF4364 family protein [Oscillospiraceae bacterium]